MGIESSSTKRIAKNSMALYLRMLFVMAINLYISRFILNELGEHDTGVYTITGGIVALFTFLNSSMSSATSRFFAFELGKKDFGKLKATFSTVLFIQICISLVVILLTETIGLWIVNHKLDIDPSRMVAANWVFQLSIFTAVMRIIQVPFIATTLANERMNIYATIEIIHVVLLLLGVLMLGYLPGDKLIDYALVVIGATTFTTLLYITVTRRKFPEVSLSAKCDKKIFTTIFSFAGWSLYSNFCLSGRTQGINIILNMTFGTVVNAAAGFAAQIESAVLTFCNNIISAFHPQIIKSYAANDIPRMESLVENALRISLFLFSMVTIPLFLQMDYILKLWLVNVPEYTCSIARIVMISAFISATVSTLNIPINATGKIRLVCLTSGSLHLCSVPLSIVALKLWHNPDAAYLSIMFPNILVLIVTFFILKNVIPEIMIGRLAFRTVFPSFACIAVAAAGSWYVSYFPGSQLLTLCITIVSYAIITTLLFTIFIFPREMVKKILRNIANRLHK